MTVKVLLPKLDPILIEHAAHAIETDLLSDDEARNMLMEELLRNVQCVMVNDAI